MDISDADISQLVLGYYYNEREGVFKCLHCEAVFDADEIFDIDSHLYTAKKAAELHVKSQHGSPFEALIGLGKKVTSLTDVHADLVKRFYLKQSDKDIAKETSTSASTVRYQRYSLREKAKQARVFLALHELMEERISSDDFPEVHKGATMVDERYMASDAETEKILKSAFSSLDPLVLVRFPPKEKKKLVILRKIAAQFKQGRRYDEKEINSVLSGIFEDYVTLRRYLIEYGFMDRTADGKQYWIK